MQWLESRRVDIERDVLDESFRLGQRLIEFFTRKTLSNWHREEFVEWISEMRQQASAMDPEAGAVLHQQFVDALGVHFDLSHEEMEARFQDRFGSEQGWDGIDDEFDDEIDVEFDDEFDEAAQRDFFEEHFSDFDEDYAAPGARGRQRREHSGHGADADQVASGRAANLTNTGWLRNLFRRAAQALHPDRESDPALRAGKQEKMQELVRARKDGDVLTMLELYAEASGESDMALAEDEMKQACTLMEEKLQQVQMETEQIVLRSPHHAMAYDEFYRISSKRREQKLKRWEREAQAEVKRLAGITEELRNLTVLKQHLSQRREESLDALQDIHDLDQFLNEVFGR